MRRYETVVIVDPDVGEEGHKALFDRTAETIAQHEGYAITSDVWGVKRMAYPIRKKPRGHYTRVEYCGDGELVNELERTLRIDDRVLKYLTVLLDADADVEAIKAAQAAEAEAERIKAEQAEAEKAAAEQAQAEKAAAEQAQTAAATADDAGGQDATPSPAATSTDDAPAGPPAAAATPPTEAPAPDAGTGTATSRQEEK